MKEVTKARVFWMFTYLMVVAAILTIAVSYASGLHHWANGLIVFASLCSIGWITILIHLASK
ncbi:MAG: hypothetical protein ABJG47_09695 [Ekhidna sp.]